MVAKRFWRPIRLVHLNVGLYLLILMVTILFGQELRWAFKELPKYWDGTIGSPIERSLYQDAKGILLEDKDMTNAHAMLNKSISIDPHTEAVLRLGEFFLRSDQNDQALEQFNKFLEIDPTQVEAYSKSASILAEQMRYEEANQVLQEGIEFFESRLHTFTPQIDPQVKASYNHKALRVFAQYHRAALRLQTERQQLEAQRRLDDDQA